MDFKKRAQQSLIGAAMLLVGTGAQAEDTVRIALAVPNQAFYTAIFVARDLGYFTDAGINAEITEYNGGTAMQEALSAGAADIGTYHPGGVALAVSKGAKQKIVGAITPGSSGWYLIVNDDSPYKEVADLEGKKVGISTAGSATDLFARWSAKQANINIQTIPVGGGGLIPSLENNQVDAVVVFQPLSFQLLASGARPLVDFSKEMPPTLMESFVATQDMIDNHPDQIKRTLGAFYKAVIYMQTNREEAIEYLKEYAKQDDPKVLDLVFENATMQESTDGTIDPQWIRAGLDLMAEGLNLPDLEHMQPSEIFDDQFLPFSPN